MYTKRCNMFNIKVKCMFFLLVLASKAHCACKMPEELPDDLLGMVSPGEWLILVERQLEQIRRSGGCETEGRGPCAIERTVVKNTPGVCSPSADGIPACLEIASENTNKLRSVLFHPDCLYLLTHDVLTRLLQNNPRPHVFQQFVEELNIDYTATRSRPTACNFTESVTESIPGSCVQSPIGYGCQATNSTLSEFGHPDCKYLEN